MEESHMRRRKLSFKHYRWGALIKFAMVVLMSTAYIPASTGAQEKGQRTYPSAEDASSAFITAIQSNDENTMLIVLGQDAKQIVSSGDQVEDKERRANIVMKYEQMHRLVREPDGTTTLYIGAENWPMPIPLVVKSNRWYFDTDAAKKEILYRRVGRNEISTIGVCQELVKAEKQYYSTAHQYAQKIFSDAGQHNGLYWKAVDGEPLSPIGPLVASAVAEGYAAGRDDAPTPYRGYFYHILTSQGKNAPGGAKDYIANGEMSGVAFVAYPAEYRSSGVMTFIVGEDGVVYQKDLGKKTDDYAKSMQKYNPDSSWRKAEDQQEKTADR
jgi:hypothetical protein